MTLFTTSAITDQYPSRKRSSGALVMIVFGIFSGRISKIAELQLEASSAYCVSLLGSVPTSVVERIVVDDYCYDQRRAKLK